MFNKKVEVNVEVLQRKYHQQVQKKKYTGVMCRLSSMGQGTDEILQHTLSLKQYKMMMPQFSEQECFFIVFSGVLLLPSFSDF